MGTREHLVRALWTLFEPIHAVSYFSSQSREAFAAIGFPRYWDGYFAGRSAPLGPVGAAPVVAIFGGFSPFFVGRALPAVWSVASVETVLEARSLGAAETLRAFFPDEDAAARAALALTPIARHADTIGRPLSAANQALPDEADPYRQLWQAAATLREHRGDGHLIALVEEGIAGLSSIVLRSSVDADAATMQRSRGWTEDQWNAEAATLESRGLLTAGHDLTNAGADAIARAEHTTNRLALNPWAGRSDDELLGVARLLAPIARACDGLFPHPNPIGLPAAWDPERDPGATAVPVTPA